MLHTMPTESVKPLGGIALALWAGFTILGVPFVYFFPQMVLALADVYDYGRAALVYALVGTICGALGGTVVGVLQRLVMPPKGPCTRFWRRGSVLGWALGGGVFWFLSLAFHIFPNPNNVSNPFLVLELIGAISGAAIGLGQALAVKQSRQMAWWIGISAGAWAVGIAGAVGLVLAVEPSDALALILAAMLVTVVGATVGLITGLAMNRLIRQV